jgi:cytochrome c
MSVSAGARLIQMTVLGGLLALSLFFPYVWFGVTPFNSDEEFSDQDIAALLEGKDIPDVYAQPLPDRSMAELTKQKDAFTWCRFCHTLNQGGHNRVGPNLHGIFGQPAAVVDHFPYSASFVELRAGGFVWTQELMERFIDDPAAMVPGNRMRYPPMIGYDKNPDRDAMIIEYLIRMTAPGAPSDDTIPSLTADETA